jgi:hypothetical protein
MKKTEMRGIFMFIKEFKKNLVILKSVGSDYIDEAWLMLKGELPKDFSGGDIVKEANRIIAEYKTGKKRRKRLPFSLPSFFLGIFTASVLAGILFLIFSVIF